MRDLAGGSTTLSYRIVDGAELKDYRFRIVGNTEVDTPAGRFATVQLERERSAGDRATTLWCAPALGYLPVRVDNREDGSTTSVLLHSYSAAP
jgi:hypothetical protein